MEESRFLKTVKRYVRFAGLPGEITLHSFRCFRLNRLAKKIPWRPRRTFGEGEGEGGGQAGFDR